MKHKVSELEGALLEQAVALVEGVELVNGCAWDNDIGVYRGWHPCTDWRVGGPIIERERIAIEEKDGIWSAGVRARRVSWSDWETDGDGQGPTPLIAAMRAYCTSKFGEEVALP